MAKTVPKTGKVPANFHGVKGRSGRKPSAQTILKRRIIENKVDEANASFAFWVAVRDNAEEPISVRLEASKLIYEHVCGKPLQANSDGGTDAFKRWQASIDGILKNGDSEADTSDQADHDAANTVPPVAGTSANPRGA